MRQKGSTGWLIFVFLMILLVLYWFHRSNLKPEHKKAEVAMAQISHRSATCYDAKGNPYSQGFIRTSPLNNNLAQVCGAKGKWEPYSSTEKK